MTNAFEVNIYAIDRNVERISDFPLVEFTCRPHINNRCALSKRFFYLVIAAKY